MGFPIRKSPDQSLFNDSPKLIAAGRVLRRLPAPRHPPYALSNLTIKFSQDKKNSATFIQLSKNCLFLFPQNLGENFIVHPILSLRGALRRSNLPGIPMRSPRLLWRLAMTTNNKGLVELTGIEPATSGLQNRRSPS